MYQAVVADIAARKERGQPVLVGTLTIRASESLAALMEETGIAFGLLTAKQDREESERIAEAGMPGKVLIATNMAGRGTHIDISPRSEEAGGLHVIVVERNDSARIDRQLIGRSARQGQPGSAQVYVSADDHLIAHYEPELADRIRTARADAGGELKISLTREIDRLQRRVERLRYDQRLKMARRDHWLDETKKTVA
jgi:preprotein translocase subunit SecA